MGEIEVDDLEELHDLLLETTDLDVNFWENYGRRRIYVNSSNKKRLVNMWIEKQGDVFVVCCYPSRDLDEEQKSHPDIITAVDKHGRTLTEFLESIEDLEGNVSYFKDMGAVSNTSGISVTAIIVGLAILTFLALIISLTSRG